MTHRQEEWSLEYTCHSPAERRWFLMYVTRYEDNGKFRIAVSHENITGRKLTGEKMLNSYNAKKNGAEGWNADLANTIEQLKQTIKKLKSEEQGLKKSETQLVQAQKLEALGELIAGLVHEVNNPNSFIMFNIPILRDYIAELMPIVDNYANEHDDFKIFNMTYPVFRDDLFKTLNNIANGSKRIDRIVASLKEFSKKNNSKRICFDP
jgi:signal transduction histidine kinase